MSVYPVEFDYGIGVEAAIDEIHFDYKHIDNMCRIPVVGTGKTTRNVLVRQFKSPMAAQEVWNKIGNHNFADPMTALAFGRGYWDMHLQFPHVTLWKNEVGGFWCQLMTELTGLRMFLVRLIPPTHELGQHHRFLTVEE